MWILIVDPDPVYRAGLAELLEAHRWAVAACADLPCALAVLRARAFDAIWTEWELGTSSARRLLTSARVSSPRAALFVVTRSNNVEMAVRLGASCFDKRRTQRAAARFVEIMGGGACGDPPPDCGQSA